MKWRFVFLPYLWISTPLFALHQEAVKFCEKPENLCKYDDQHDFLSIHSLKGNSDHLQQILQDLFQRVPTLTRLNLSGNHLIGLPDAIGQFTSLTTLELSQNSLTGLPDAIGRLTSLTRLHLNDNLLTGLPDAIGQFRFLTGLDLSDNRLAGLPDAIGRLTALTWLDLSDNRLTGLPDAIGRLTSLTRLNLADNPNLTYLPLPNSMVNRSHELAFILPRNPQMLAQVTRTMPGEIRFEAEDVTRIAGRVGVGHNPGLAGQEALTAIRSDIIHRWATYAQSHQAQALLRKWMPAEADVAEAFSDLYAELAPQLERQSALQTENPKTRFRLLTALRGLKLLHGDEGMPIHPVSSQKSYQTVHYQGIPTNLQLVVFLYRVLKQKLDETYIRHWLGEKYARGMGGFPLKTHFPQGSIGEVLTSEKGPLLVSTIMEVIQGGDKIGEISSTADETKAFWQLCQKIGKDQKESSIPIKDAFTPLIEALFMTMRGHNTHLERQEVGDRPACADGAYLGSLRAIWEASDLGQLAQGLDMDIIPCGA